MSSLIRFRYSPFTEFDRLFDYAFNARLLPSTLVMLRPANTPRLDSFRPRVDVKESKDDNAITATFELPGLKSEDVSIDFQQDRLTISGESTSSNSHEKEGYALRERRYGKFSRTLQLPLGTKSEDVKAKLENGLLTVTFPKSVPEQQPQRITIQ